nr:MAG TPA: hypothetical protein [Bacteriophage sp.]
MLFSYKQLLYYSTVNHWLIVACIHHYTLWRYMDHLNFLQLNKQLFLPIIYLISYCSFVAS